MSIRDTIKSLVTFSDAELAPATLVVQMPAYCPRCECLWVYWSGRDDPRCICPACGFAVFSDVLPTLALDDTTIRAKRSIGPVATFAHRRAAKWA